jgi:hypothetical protein
MKIAKLFESWRTWIKNAYARNHRASDDQVLATSPDATCWCLLGAVKRCYPIEQRHAVMDKLAASIKELFPRRVDKVVLPRESGETIITFNDTKATRFADVLKVVNHAKV